MSLEVRGAPRLQDAFGDAVEARRQRELELRFEAAGETIRCHVFGARDVFCYMPSWTKGMPLVQEAAADERIVSDPR